MTQLTGLFWGYCQALQHYVPTIFGLPSLIELDVCITDRQPPDAEAVRARYRVLSSNLTSLVFIGGTQIMVRHLLIRGQVKGF